MSTAALSPPMRVAASAVLRGTRPRPRVYVSSSVSDLRDARAAVIEAVVRSGCEAVAMESYGADSRPPVERCLLDVASCEVYVGIVAWRYGSCPPGEEKSFTHLEYEEAARCGKQILLFHLDDGAPWLPKHVDSSKSQVVALRKAQAEKHIVDHFATVGQLSAGVGQALHRLYGEAATPVPALLPYVADRHAQQDRLAAAAGQHELTRSPSLVVVHGPVGHAHHKFVEYMQEQLLARHLRIAGPVHPVDIGLRSAELDQPDTITRRIARECSLEATVDVDVLSRELHDFGALTMLRIPVEVELRRGQALQIVKLIDYFARWPERQPLRVLPVISAQYREPSGWSGRLRWGASAADRLAQAISDAAASSERAIVVLPELTNVEQFEVVMWANLPEVRRFLGDRDVVPVIRRMFAEYERTSRMRGIPMEKLAVELTHLLHHRSRWQEAA